MATSNRTLKDDLAEYHDRLDAALRSRYGMSFIAFRLIKATTQLVGSAAGIYAMHLGAPPLPAFALTAFIIGGPEAIEYLIDAGGN